MSTNRKARATKTTPERFKKVHQLNDNGVSKPEIMRIMNLAECTVRRILKYNNAQEYLEACKSYIKQKDAMADEKSERQEEAAETPVQTEIAINDKTDNPQNDVIDSAIELLRSPIDWKNDPPEVIEKKIKAEVALRLEEQKKLKDERLDLFHNELFDINQSIYFLTIVIKSGLEKLAAAWGMPNTEEQ